LAPGNSERGSSAIDLLDKIRLDRQALRRLAGPRSFERGEAYFADGRVLSLGEHRGAVVAKVRGAETYSAKLWVDGKKLDYSCDCPRGDDGEFCKHCVAVGLAVIAGTVKPSAPRRRKPKVTLDDVRDHLSSEQKSVLVDLLMERAVWDDALRDQLFLKAAKKRGKGAVDLEAIKEALDRAIDPGDYLNWGEVRDYSNGVDEAVNTIEEVLDDGHAAEAIDLAEHALRSTEAAVEFVHDDGEMSGILERLQELHLRACKKAKPNPVALARRLFEGEIGSGYDVFYGAATTYARILGQEGLAEYRRLAEECWRKVQPLGPAENDPERYRSRSRLTSIMMTLTKASGDVEAQAEVLKRDLSRPHDFFNLATLYRDSGLHDLAMEWAEKGLKAFPHTDSRLLELVADEYHRRGRHSDAMDLLWTELAKHPDLERYKNLKRHADRTKTWPAWREKALAAIGDATAKRKRGAEKSPWSLAADHSSLVEIHLWERRLEAAWNEAQTGGCNAALWMVLAGRREKNHPQDALPIYQREVESTLRRASNHSYVEAIQLLKKIGQVMRRIGRDEDFKRYLDSVRATHARKRNFVRLLSHARWG
jgi:uncharacterized Zn finger protein